MTFSNNGWNYLFIYEFIYNTPKFLLIGSSKEGTWLKSSFSHAKILEDMAYRLELARF